MPLNAGWRCSKIVIPPIPNQGEKLISGLKNALDRGETLVKAQQSFINAGYKPAEVRAAAQRIPMATSPIGKQVVKSSETSTQPQTTNPLQANMGAEQPKKLSRKAKIILISVSAIILIGAMVLGLFWNTIF